MTTAQDQQSRAEFEAWWRGWQASTWTWADREMPEHWNINAKRHMKIAWEAARVQSQDVEPMFWVRLRSDGCYEGPLHSASIEDVRKTSGAWTPLYTAAQVQAMGRVPPATKVSRAHEFRPNKKYPWFCADCGYAPHDELMHTAAPRPPAAQEGA